MFIVTNHLTFRFFFDFRTESKMIFSLTSILLSILLSLFLHDTSCGLFCVFSCFFRFTYFPYIILVNRIHTIKFLCFFCYEFSVSFYLLYLLYFYQIKKSCFIFFYFCPSRPQIPKNTEDLGIGNSIFKIFPGLKK